MARVNSSRATWYRELEDRLNRYEHGYGALPGLLPRGAREAFVKQIVDSIRRVEYFRVIQQRDIGEDRSDPESEDFDPIRSAIHWKMEGNVDEAFWLIFLHVHFGKHRRYGWQLARDVYRAMGNREYWSWEEASHDSMGFRQWVADNQGALKGDGVRRGFGNHRKYQSLDADSPNGTGAAVVSYVDWVGPTRTHAALISNAEAAVGTNRKTLFNYLYDSMGAVASFGRTARFDYLTTIGHLGLAEVEPGKAYLNGATGPLAGVRLLFEGSARGRGVRVNQLELKLAKLDKQLNVGMQVLEDSLCNWQKTPLKYVRFLG